MLILKKVQSILSMKHEYIFSSCVDVGEEDSVGASPQFADSPD